jgi:ABC-type multidrug transport system fused ATPase/permease subunit
MTNGITLTADTDKTEMDVILDDVSFSYVHMETEVVSALSDVSLSLERGSYTALLGRNGSGKSTMAKLIDVLELPQEGNVLVVGRNTNDESVFCESVHRAAWFFRTRTIRLSGLRWKRMSLSVRESGNPDS